MRDAGCGPAVPDPAGARGTPHNWGAGLPGVSRALPVGGPCADARRARVRGAVFRVEGKGRTVLLARSVSTLWAVSWWHLPHIDFVPEMKNGNLAATIVDCALLRFIGVIVATAVW